MRYSIALLFAFGLSFVLPTESQAQEHSRDVKMLSVAISTAVQEGPDGKVLIDLISESGPKPPISLGPDLIAELDHRTVDAREFELEEDFGDSSPADEDWRHRRFSQGVASIVSPIVHSERGDEARVTLIIVKPSSQSEKNIVSMADVTLIRTENGGWQVKSIRWVST